uniref:Ig-like domain-containing protein n=1 Tax=Aceria tosichella TaxID=561515 RepID=A0A6G1S6W5_9ACAR
MPLKNLLQADQRKGWRRIRVHQTDKQARFLLAFVILIVMMMLHSAHIAFVHSAGTNLAGVSEDRHSNGASGADADAETGASSLSEPFRRRSRRATAVRSQATAVASSGAAVAARARPTTSKPPQNRQQQQQQTTTNAEAELLAQQQQASRSIKNVTAQNGQSVLLHCLVEPTAGGELPEVSWFRGTAEPQLLTYDTNTIIRDERFLVRQGSARSNDWALQIKNLNKTTDAGLYQCQTSGDSPQLQSYQLNIVEPQVDILGAPDLAIRVGAPINLTCVISQSADEPQFVFWYRDERMINYDFASDESRAKIVLSKWNGQQRDSITSQLQIFQSQPSDSGNYTCAPSGARPSSIQVHVLEATDKRLMMFQQDDSSAALAASSHQTSSAAISAHVIRLSRGRAYAFLVGLFILATWFQLIAQLQTLISLALLAVIGLLLGQRGDAGSAANSGRRRQGLEAASGEDDVDYEKMMKKKSHCGGGVLLFNNNDNTTSGGGPGAQLGDKEQQQLQADCYNNSSSGLLLSGARIGKSLAGRLELGTGDNTTRHDDEQMLGQQLQFGVLTAAKRGAGHHHHQEDPLIRGAEEALSLLRTLGDDRGEEAQPIEGRTSGCSSVELDGNDQDGGNVVYDDDDEPAFRSLSFGALDELGPAQRGHHGPFETRTRPSPRPLASLRHEQSGRPSSRQHQPSHQRVRPSELGPRLINNITQDGHQDNGASNGSSNNNTLRAPKANGSQASPGASSSSSSSATSTGYNSDSTRLCSSSTGGMRATPTTPRAQTIRPTTRTPNVSLLDEQAAQEFVADESELEVIELIKGRPATAMRLIIEHLQQSGQFSELAELATTVASGGSRSVTNSMGRNCKHRPSGRGSGSGTTMTNETSGAENEESSIYSIPPSTSLGKRTVHHNQDKHSHNDDDKDDCKPLDLSRSELAKRSASATFERPD